MLLASGSDVDRWRVEAEVGRGGMARVYRVRHRTLDTVAALKVLTLNGGELRERLLREGRVQSRLDHPNLVVVRDVLDLPEGPGLILDYVDGPSLDRWLEEERPDAATRERVFLDIVAAVEQAHAQGVVHRDLKPANVLMERRDGGWRPRVTDFGLAKLVGGEEDAEGLQSRTGRPMGTPAYMAPEQVRSAKHVDHRADVFALGCILYELACGHRAFQGQDSLEVFNRVTQGRFVRPRDLVRELPGRLEAAVLGALALEPEDRIPDCATLAKVVTGAVPWTVARADVARHTLLDLAASSIDPTRGSRPSGIAAVTMAPVSSDEWDAPAAGASGVAHTTGPHVAAIATAPPVTPADPSVSEGAAVASSPSPAPSSARRWAPAAVGLALLVAAAAMALWARPSKDPSAPATVPASSPVLLPAASRSSPSRPDAAAPPPTAASAVTAPTPLSRPARPAVPASPAAPATPVQAATSSGDGQVDLLGDARSVRLRGAGASHGPGAVPPGSYVIEADFGAGPVHAGNLVVRADARYRLDCRVALLTCSLAE